MAHSSNTGAVTRGTIGGAYIAGWRRVLAAPWVTAGIFAMTVATAIPLAWVVQRDLEAHLGNSLQAERAVTGWNEGWAVEFGTQAQGPARTFTHEILGFGATIGILSDLLDRESVNPAIAGAIGTYIAIWIFLAGGIIDRLARGRRIGAPAFFAACGTFFFRFIRLGLIVGAAYWAMFRWVHPWLFERVYPDWIRNLTVEREAAFTRFALYGVFVLGLAAIGLVSDLAKIRAVVEDRHSMIGAVAAALRFIRRRAFRLTGLWLLNAATLALVSALWWILAPSASAPVLVALLLTQLYVLLRLWIKLAWLASGIVFFQQELAHAGYTAAPLPIWPDSPAAEAIENMVQRRS